MVYVVHSLHNAFTLCVCAEAKNAGRLLERLREGKVGDTEAKVDEYWDDLTTVVQDSLEQWKKTINPPRDLHFLNAIMDEILEVPWHLPDWAGMKNMRHLHLRTLPL